MTTTNTIAGQDDSARVERRPTSRSQRGVVGRHVFFAYEKIASILIAGVFLASGVLHMENPYYFLGSVYSYEMTGPRIGEGVAMVLPITQIGLAACLLGRVFVGGALLLGTGISCVFVAAQAAGLWRELKIDCGCFGAAYTQSIGTATLLLSCGMLVLGISAYFTWRFQRIATEGSDLTASLA
jgi:hypothetical protein